MMTGADNDLLRRRIGVLSDLRHAFLLAANGDGADMVARGSCPVLCFQAIIIYLPRICSPKVLIFTVAAPN